MRYNESQKFDALNITDEKDVVDYATCMSYAQNLPINFRIIFKHGSNIQQIRDIQTGLQSAYPRATIVVKTEDDAVAQSVDIYGDSVHTESDMEKWKKDLAARATPKIEFTAPAVDLGSGQQFQDVLTPLLDKATGTSFEQYSGQVPSSALTGAAKTKQMVEEHCERKYKDMSAAERSQAEIAEADGAIKSLVRGGLMVSAPTYFSGHASYAPGPLALNSGICSDSGAWGLKRSIDQLTTVAGVAYCYASQSALAVSAPLKSDPSKGYCADSNGYEGIVDSPMAAQQGYCVAPEVKQYDLSSCQQISGIRQRWGCVGDQLNQAAQRRISSITGPYAAPDADKIKYCKTLTGLEADYCYVSMTQAYRTAAIPNAQVCANMSNMYPWFKADCIEGRP
ncbi:MAG: hypothetical protein WC030_01850 [Candidatus Paceibacterota bacterium]